MKPLLFVAFLTVLYSCASAQLNSDSIFFQNYTVADAKMFSEHSTKFENILEAHLEGYINAFDENLQFQRLNKIASNYTSATFQQSVELTSFLASLDSIQRNRQPSRAQTQILDEKFRLLKAPQDQVTASLEGCEVMNKLPFDTSKGFRIYTDCFAYAMNIAKRQPDLSIKVDCYEAIARFYSSIFDLRLATKAYQAEQLLFTDTKTKADIAYDIATVLYEENPNPFQSLSTDYYDHASKLYWADKDTFGYFVSQCEGKIGKLQNYNSRSTWHNDVEFAVKMLNYGMSHEVDNRFLANLNVLSGSYFEAVSRLYGIPRKTITALKFYEHGLEFAIQGANGKLISNCLNSISRCYAFLGNYEKAMQYQDEVFAFYANSQSYYSSIRNYLSKACLLITLKRHDEAKNLITWSKLMISANLASSNENRHLSFYALHVERDMYFSMGKQDSFYLLNDKCYAMMSDFLFESKEMKEYEGDAKLSGALNVAENTHEAFKEAVSIMRTYQRMAAEYKSVTLKYRGVASELLNITHAMQDSIHRMSATADSLNKREIRLKKSVSMLERRMKTAQETSHTLWIVAAGLTMIVVVTILMVFLKNAKIAKTRKELNGLAIERIHNTKDIWGNVLLPIIRKNWPLAFEYTNAAIHHANTVIDLEDMENNKWTLLDEMTVLRAYELHRKILVSNFDVVDDFGSLAIEKISFIPEIFATLLENSLEHGFTDISKMYRFAISAKRRGGLLEFEIQDNGIFNGADSYFDESKPNRGLNFLRQRIKNELRGTLRFAQKDDFVVEKNEMNGTTIKFKYPYAVSSKHDNSRRQ